MLDPPSKLFTVCCRGNQPKIPVFDPRLLLHQPTLYSFSKGPPACCPGNFQLLIHPGGPPNPSQHFQWHRPPKRGELCAYNLGIYLGMFPPFKTILRSKNTSPTNWRFISSLSLYTDHNMFFVHWNLEGYINMFSFPRTYLQCIRIF